MTLLFGKVIAERATDESYNSARGAKIVYAQGAHIILLQLI